MAELLLDTNIRGWVFLPIVVITFLVGIPQLKGRTATSTGQSSNDAGKSASENGMYLTRTSFLMRRHFFNNEDSGYFKTQKRVASAQNPVTDPSVMTDMLKGNIINVLPMIMIGGWINWMFSGFVSTKVPFPLTLRFKPMLQRGIELISLDAAWVSSASWYFLNVFGLLKTLALVLGENNAADTTRHFQEHMSGAAMAMPPDPKAAFKSEWEALEICEHRWALSNAENDLMNMLGPTVESMYHQSKLDN